MMDGSTHVHQQQPAKAAAAAASASAPEAPIGAIVEDAHTKQRHKINKKWNRRIRTMLCCLGYKRHKGPLSDVASIFAEFFSDLKLSYADLWSGSILVSKHQTAQRKYIAQNHVDGVEKFVSCVPITSSTEFLDFSNPEDSHLLNELIHYMHYSLAVFGWPVLALEDSMCWGFRVCPRLRPPCCRCRSKVSPTGAAEAAPDDAASSTRVGSPTSVASIASTATSAPVVLDAFAYTGPEVINDNLCGCHMATLETRLAPQNYETIYVNYSNDIHRIPFLVVADHSRRSIVIAIRGSMSLSDIVTDMDSVEEKFPLDGCPDTWLCHKGITRATVYVRDLLLRERILERAFACRPDLDSSTYGLVICGHSLGAGAAAILGILLRARYPTLKAYCYSPPGGMLSLPVVEYTKQFATGIILGTDLVPRLGLVQLERLRYWLILSLAHSNKSHTKVLAKQFCPCLKPNKQDYDPKQPLSDFVFGKDLPPIERKGVQVRFEERHTMLMVPGRLIHIIRSPPIVGNSGKATKHPPVFQAVWTDNTMYDRIYITENMLTDHMPNKLMEAMKMIFCSTLPPTRRRSSAATATNASAISTQPGHNVSPTPLSADHLQRQYKSEWIQPLVRGKGDIIDENNNEDDVAYPNVNAYDLNNNNDADSHDRNLHRTHSIASSSSSSMSSINQETATLKHDKSFDENGNELEHSDERVRSSAQKHTNDDCESRKRDSL